MCQIRFFIKRLKDFISICCTEIERADLFQHAIGASLIIFRHIRAPDLRPPTSCPVTASTARILGSRLAFCLESAIFYNIYFRLKSALGTLESSGNNS
jgi:hypothetical protein